MGKGKGHGKVEEAAAPSAPTAAAEPELQPRGNAAAAQDVGKDGPAPADEHTIFVDGTWQSDEEEYWSPDVQDAAHDLFGSDSGETFSWYGGPNDARARRMAGRKLYREGVLPAFERGETVNMLAHSHGGNVVGEMGAYADHRREHVERMHRAASGSGIMDLGADLAAYTSIGAQLGGLGLEALDLLDTNVEQGGSEAEKVTNFTAGMGADRREAAREAMLQQLGEEASSLLADGAAVAGGDAGRFESEREALAKGQFGDLIFAQTPFLDEHANPLDSETIMGTADRIDSFSNDSDLVAGGARRDSDDEGRQLTTGREPRPDGPEVHEHTWIREEGKIHFDPRYNHSVPINDADAFREEYGAVIAPERYESEEEAAASRAAAPEEASESSFGAGLLGF